MSAERDSTTKLVKVYIRLLDEGTDVSRPTDCIELGHGLYRVLPTPDYDPEDEKWEFPPGSVVRAEPRQGSVGEYLLAVSG